MRRTFISIILRDKNSYNHVNFTDRCIGIKQTDRRIILKTVNEQDKIKVYSIDRNKYEIHSVNFYMQKVSNE